MTQEITRDNDLEMEIEVTLQEGGRWFSTTVTCSQMLEVIKTGLLDNKPIAALKMWTITGDTHSIVLVYDVILAGKGVSPWRLNINTP